MLWFSAPPAPSSPPDPSKLALRPEESQKITLPDTRTLGYATYGSPSPTAPTIFLFHGLPGSRLVGRGWDTLCKKLGARLITIDRPGCGLSTLADRGLTDWPEDVVSLADHLGIARFSVIGASGGGPFALACARFISGERLRGTTVVCGIGPIEAVLDTVPGLSWRLGGATEWVVRGLARWFILPSIVRPYETRDPARLKRVLEDQCKTDEEKAFVREEAGSDMGIDNSVAMFLEAFKQGSAGCMHDGAVISGDWGFELRDVDSEKVWLVHGDQDTHAELKLVRWIDERLGGGRLTVLEGKTHFTIWKDHSEEIFRQSAEA